ncbi:MAG TPA: MFS transporter [bacterium]|jgi:MFS family permease|nr:MFS transporter [bacterium]
MAISFASQARTITRTLFGAQSLGSAATITAFPILTILGAQLSGLEALAGLPATVYLTGQALSAFLWGSVMDRIGRRGALILGAFVGSAGMLVSAVAVAAGSFPLFMTGALLIGMATAALALSRFVAAEVHPPDQRARAISSVVLGGTVGALLGPVIAGVMVRVARVAAFSEFMGPFLAGTALFALVALVLFVWLRPEPGELGRAIAAASPGGAPVSGPARPILTILRERPAIVAVAAMIFGQMTMAMLMVITSLHMRHHDHPLTSISFVISAHVVGMYAFSIISGRLADAWGRGPVIMVGASVLVLACLTAPLSPQLVPLAVALFLLGLGWNFCYVAGSSLLADQLSPSERARTQGFNDLLLGLTSALGSLGSGVVFAAVGYGAMGVVGAAAALIPLSLAAWWRLGQRIAPVSASAD